MAKRSQPDKGDTKTAAKTPEEDDYPSVDLAYSIAVASFEVAAKRFDSIDGKLQTLMAFVATVSVAIPSLAAGRGITFSSRWLYIAAVFFLVSMALGVWARLMGTLKVLMPSVLFREWLSVPGWEFKKDMIYYAGTAFDDNLKIVALKWKCTVIMTVLFVLEVLCLTAWVLSGRS